MTKAPSKASLLRKQPAMRKVLLGLVPCAAGSVYYFGWRSLAMIAFCCAWGFLLEWLFCRTRKEPVSEAVFVTAVLFALIMPPGVGWHVLAVGMGFSVIFSKEVFGGFGRNIFNPALAGRCFVYICFPVALTGVWQPPASAPPGALTRWTTAVWPDGTDATTGATPMAHLKAGHLVRSSDADAFDSIPYRVGDQEQIKISNPALLKAQLFGTISGTMGVTSALLILIGGVYLFWTKTASRTTILSVILTYIILNQGLYWLGVKPVPGAWPAVLGGGFLLGAFFMATDPVSSPKTEPGRIFYGILIGIATLVIRNFSIFNGGLMFAILLGNMFTPIIDYGVKAWQERHKSKGIAAEAAR
jgi:Na+-transporting NADH:ubiquinone oxidoreductase subunit B